VPFVDEALELLSPDFEAMYSAIGRPSIPPEKLLRALLLQAFYTIRLERQLMEQMDYNLLFRWFAGLSMDAPIWDVTVFTKNRERLLAGDIAAKFLAALLGQPRVKALLSDEHFSVDGTLIEAWASMRGSSLRTTQMVATRQRLWRSRETAAKCQVIFSVGWCDFRPRQTFRDESCMYGRGGSKIEGSDATLHNSASGRRSSYCYGRRENTFRCASGPGNKLGLVRWGDEVAGG
jgi:transposase